MLRRTNTGELKKAVLNDDYSGLMRVKRRETKTRQDEFWIKVLSTERR